MSKNELIVYLEKALKQKFHEDKRAVVQRLDKAVEVRDQLIAGGPNTIILEAMDLFIRSIQKERDDLDSLAKSASDLLQQQYDHLESVRGTVGY